MCRQLANAILPAVNGKTGRQAESVTVDPLPALGSPSASNEEICSLMLQQGLSLLKTAANVVGRPDFVEALSRQRTESISQDLEPISRALYKTNFSKKQEVFSGSSRLSHTIIIWDILKYSLMSTEVAARGTSTLTSLYKEFKCSSEFIFSLLLRVVQNLCHTNSLHARQRFGALQLFAESICNGILSDYHSTQHKVEDNLLHLLEPDDKEALHPCVQFWNRAADPVLAHDPFSSLMWVLFSLPFPFLSCEESVLSLVHVFYVVSVIQAIITCCGIQGYSVNELSSHHRLITDICSILGESDCARVSNEVQLSCDIKDIIRRSSFPYLRRCALLWKTLKSSDRSPFCDSDNVWKPSHMMDATKITSTELNEVQKLEKMFKIPPIDVILDDEVSRSFALKWFRHLHKVYRTSSVQNVFNCNPAVPFKLLSLPHVYEELFLRYISQCCPDCKTVVDEPALCLLCGRLCSSSGTPCCRESGCKSHAKSCGAGIGVFLLVKRTTILLQRCASQASWSSPYLDKFGEEDIERSRGTPLFLNEERYALLTYMVASHGLNQNSNLLGRRLVWFHV